jgi:hypothetical protein
MISEASAVAAEDKEPGNQWLYWLLISFATVHGLLLTLDARYPWVFLRGDRATTRLAAIEALHRLSGWHAIVAYLGTHGNIGDYAPQICLMLLSGICVFRLGRRCDLSARASCLATALYLASPHSLVLPHQLCSEALFVPLVAISTWVTTEALRRRNQVALSCSGLLLGIAGLVRPVILVWPVVAVFGLRRYAARAAPLVFAAAAYMPIVVWMVFVWQETGTPGMGASDHSLAVNLYGRVESIAATMPPNETRTITARYLAGERRLRAMTALNYLSFAANYPLPVLRYAIRDTEVLLFKSGVERITVDYFANDQQVRILQTRDGNGWRQYWDKHGALATMRYAWQVLGITFLISMLAAAVQVALILLAVVGAVHVVGLIRHHTAHEATKLAEFLVLALPIYILIFSQLADAAQSRHRAPAEFALAILATHGIRQTRSAWRARATRRRQPQPATC